MKLSGLLALVASLFSCSSLKPQVLDGPDMVYKDSDYRTIYANVFDFDSYDGQPMFAVAFLGYGDRMEVRHAYVEGLFKDLGDFATSQVGHIDYDGDEWYLVVPRYMEDVEITNPMLFYTNVCANVENAFTRDEIDGHLSILPIHQNSAQNVEIYLTKMISNSVWM